MDLNTHLFDLGKLNYAQNLGFCARLHYSQSLLHNGVRGDNRISFYSVATFPLVRFVIAQSAKSTDVTPPLPVMVMNCDGLCVC